MLLKHLIYLQLTYVACVFNEATYQKCGKKGQLGMGPEKNGIVNESQKREKKHSIHYISPPVCGTTAGSPPKVSISAKL